MLTITLEIRVGGFVGGTLGSRSQYWGEPVQSLIRIIQQRKIDRVAAAYSVAGWLLVQAASIVLPTFGAPAWVLKVLIIGAICGFPVALWIAWHVAPAPRSKHGAPPPPSTVTDILLLLSLGLVLFVAAAQLFAAIGLLPSLSKSTVGSKEAAETVGQQLSPAKTSIAVLPFTNMSGDSSKDYFSDGISEELLNQLANVSDLRVAARTSSFAFKGKNEDIRNIAHALNVRAVLEGSVREDGQHIRITAQLINAADGYHMWSKTYDRDLSNILQVQDEIARAITTSLTQGLLGNWGAAAPNRDPINPQAYKKYLEAKSFAALKTDDGDAKAIELFKEVTQAEPNFAPSYAALGRATIHLAQFHNRRSDLVLAAQLALDRAIRLDPRNLEALSSELLLALMKWDWQKATQDARMLQSVNPHSVFTLRGLHDYYGSLGFPEQQSAALREATRLDPLSFVDLNNLASVYNNRGEYAEAASAAEDALSLQPDRSLTLYTLCSAYVGMKRFREAQSVIDWLATRQIDASQACALKSAAASGQNARARDLADKIAKRFPSFVFGETDIGEFYAAAGDYVKAMAWFDRAYDKHDISLLAISYFAATPAELLKTPSWTSLKQRPEARAWQTVHNSLSAELGSD